MISSSPNNAGNLACNNGGNSPASFPEEFGGFTYLEVLDLSYNILIGECWVAALHGPCTE